jgi:hypothetical protein
MTSTPAKARPQDIKVAPQVLPPLAAIIHITHNITAPLNTSQLATTRYDMSFLTKYFTGSKESNTQTNPQVATQIPTPTQLQIQPPIEPSIVWTACTDGTSRYQSPYTDQGTLYVNRMLDDQQTADLLTLVKDAEGMSVEAVRKGGTRLLDGRYTQTKVGIWHREEDQKGHIATLELADRKITIRRWGCHLRTAVTTKK